MEDREKNIREMVRVAKNKVLISELSPIGAKFFDEVLHPGENHQKRIVSMDWVEAILNGYGNLEISIRPYTYFILLIK